MKNKIVEFLKDESGQTSTEYILLLAVVAAIIFKFKSVITEKLNGLVEGVFNSQGMQDLVK
jgi:pilus assembly protein Flp/PilA